MSDESTDAGDKNLKRRASDQPFAHVSYTWTDERLEADYRACMAAIEKIRRDAMAMCEPISKHAAYLHSIGTKPCFIQVVKP